VNRREFIMLIGGAAAWPAAAREQQTGKVPTIGLLGSGTAAAQSQWTAAFVTRLREIGWTERRNIAIEYRWAEGRSERFVEIAEEFVRLKVDVIVTHNTLPALAAKQATSAIPIVFATAGDPLGTGIVASLARPGGITGLSSQHPDATGKRLELLRRIETENDWIAMGFDENLGKALDAAKSETAKLIAEQRNIGAEQGLSTPRCAQLARALRLAVPRSAEGDARTCQCLGTELIDGWVRPET
jgi:ABC-type uncharacterized transport system substrate-binding protein